MDYIKLALEKAQSTRSKPKTAPVSARSKSRSSAERIALSNENTALADLFTNNIEPQLDTDLLENNRVVSYDMKDPSYIAFNILRTRILSVLSNNGWNSIAISSPGPSCGKTTVSVNLALSFARQEKFKTVLVDLDLRNPSIARTLGIRVQTPLLNYLTGEQELEDCFVKGRNNLVMALNNEPITNTSELMLHQRCRDLKSNIVELLKPDLIIFDLPPLLISDDTIGFLPYVDSSMMVVAEGKTKFREISQSDKKMSSVDNFLGYVLNMSLDHGDTSYYYSSPA